MKIWLTLFLWIMATPCWAAEIEPESAETPLATKITDPDDRLSPQVIIERDGDIIREVYKQHGQVVMIKFIPKKGPPWYLLDSDGDGSLETTTEEFAQVQPVYWTLFTW